MLASLTKLVTGLGREVGQISDILVDTARRGSSGVPRASTARYNSLQEFQAFMRETDNHPSYTNLFTLQIATPPIMQSRFLTNKFVAERGDLSLLLDFYAQSVSLPSKQITSGQVVNVGSAVKYATGSAFSQFQVNFLMPRSQYTRVFFERWMSMMANDANQMTEFYEDYCSPRIMIYKWERGGGHYAHTQGKHINALRGNPRDAWVNSRLNKVTAAWELRNVYPYNIGSAQLNNNASALMNIGISFYYERYRFYPETLFDDRGVTTTVDLPDDNYWDANENTGSINTGDINIPFPIILPWF